VCDSRSTAKLGPVVYCHCSQCRRASGSAFASNASARAQDFRIVAGAELISEYNSSPGQHRAFCSRCGSPVYCRIDSAPEIRRVRLGTLDGDPGQRAIAHVWTDSKSSWFEITDELERWEDAPPEAYSAGPAKGA
jgi:hypothetical protein